MKKLTTEQKAKRYEYLERAILEFLDKKIEDYKYDEGDNAPAIDVVDNWMDKVDFNDDVIPYSLYMLFDKIMDEEFYTYHSFAKDRKEYKQFEQQIGA